MKNLNIYFDLFDQSRTDEQAFEELISLFSNDLVFVLNGHKKQGIENFKLFVQMVFTENADIKHMFEGWKAVEGTDTFATPWAVCGKRSAGSVFTQTGKDIAKLNDDGKICYLENIPDNASMFDSYNS
ncbi:nuclear transport factor 2 family protein [Metabacillus sp. SLBN-84]